MMTSVSPRCPDSVVAEVEISGGGEFATALKAAAAAVLECAGGAGL